MQKRTLLELISMRNLLLILLSVLLSSCPAESNDIINLLLKRDRKSPTLTSYELLENRICMLSFDEIVTVTDARLDEESLIRPYRKSKSVWIEFSSPLLPGVEKKLFLTAEDDAGNTSRFALRLTGVNLRQAELLITEVSMKGTESSPDRIELTAMSSGSTLGYAIQDGIIGHERYRYILPEIELRKNDIIVIYWDRCESLPSTLIRDTEKTYYLYAESPETLIGTNGLVVLYNHTNGKGKVEDAFLYNTSDATNNNGYGNSISEESAKYLMEIGEWSGKTFLSDGVTSSRTASRYFPYEDTNTKDDFYIAASRKSTFGYPNTNIIYEP